MNEGVAWWYPTLQTPDYAPPMWAFFPIGAVIYGAMGAAAWMVWRSAAALRAIALALFGLQLLLTGLWFWIFFGAHRLPLAAFGSILLALAVVATLALFGRVRKSAGWLMAPQLLWVCYLALVSYGIWRMNPYEGLPKSAVPPASNAQR